MMTWNELGEKIASMTPEQRRQPLLSVADRFALTAIRLNRGEEAPENLNTVTGAHYDLTEIEDIGDGQRVAWYFQR
jgi:hypothetical protein